MNALDIALKMETDAVAFYQDAAEKTPHPVGKKMFLSITKDEERHVEIIQKIIDGMDIHAEDVDPMENIKTIFEESKDEMMERIAATEDELKALKIAMEMEERGLEFYRKAAAGATDPKEKALFERLALEEEKHYQVFSNTYFFMSDTGNWFMWDEHSMVDGGTPTA